MSFDDDWEHFAASTASKANTPADYDEDDDGSDPLESWDSFEPTKASNSSQARSTSDSGKPKIGKLPGRSSRDASASSFQSESLSKEEMRKRELEADLRNASDLFGDLSVADSSALSSNPKDTKAKSGVINISGPTKRAPSSKSDFDKIYDQIIKLLQGGEKSVYYTPMIKELMKVLCKPLSEAQVKLIIGELNKYALQKANEQKAANKAKSAPSAKASSAFSRKQSGAHDLKNYDDEDFDDDFDDFM